MARARNIKPAIMDNEDLSDFSPMTRLLFVYLWMLADREGRLEDRPKRIGARAFPYDRSADVDAMLGELASGGFIKRYEADGIKVIQINSFLKHQTPHGTEKDSVLPDEQGKYTVHKRQKNGYATGETSLNDSPRSVKEQSDNCVLTVKKLSTNTLNPDSPNPDSLIPDSSPSNEGEPPRAKRKPSRTSMPEDFDISDRVRDWAKEKGYENLGAHLEAFKAKVHAKGYQYVNWDSAFMEAIREDWAKLRGQGAVRGQAPPPERAANPWWETGPGIRSKGIELGIGDWRDGAEQWHPYRNAVFKAAKARGELPEGVGI